MKNVQIRLTDAQFKGFTRRWKKAGYKNLQEVGSAALLAVGTNQDHGYHHAMIDVILESDNAAVADLLTQALQLLEGLSRGGE